MSVLPCPVKLDPRKDATASTPCVTVICPGVIRTPILSGGAFGRMELGVDAATIAKLWEQARPMDPRVFAKKALDRVGRNEAIIVLPTWWKAFWYLDRVSPSMSMALSRWISGRLQAEIARGTA